jgi:hypothetical protein
MKRRLSFLLVLRFSAVLWALEAGIDTEQTTIFLGKNEYAPETSSAIDTALFVRYMFYGRWNYLNAAPMIKIQGDVPRFGFYELDASFFINSVSVSLGKNNFYFGEGMSKNIFFPMLPLPGSRISKQKFWNGRLNAAAGNFALSLGYIADTESIDTYRVPEWHSVYCTIDYSQESYSAAVEGDARFNGSGGATGKTALAFKSLLGDTVSLYSTSAYAYTEDLSFEKSFSVIAGVSKRFSLHPAGFTSILESSYAESVVNMSFYQNIEYKDFVLTGGISACRDLNTDKNRLKPQIMLAWYISSLGFEISYSDGDLLSEDKSADGILFLGVNYAFTFD